MNKLTVKYKNDLNNVPMRKFNAKEMDLFFSICAKIKNKSCTTVSFSFEELKGLSNYKITSLNHFIKDLENVYDKMLNLKYRVEDDDGTIDKFVLFTKFRINPKNKTVEISVQKELEYILNELTKEFTQFELQEFTDLTSSYSKTMYRLLKQFKNTGYYTVKVDEFRDLLDIPISYRMTHITQKVLNPVSKELSQYFEFFKIKKIKASKGNKIDRLEFYFKEKDNSNLPSVPMFNWLE